MSIIGNKTIQRYFDVLVKDDALSHAYLFLGPQGVGKKTFALNLAKEVAGDQANNLDIRFINKENSPSHSNMSGGGKQIYVSESRDLKSFLSLTPFGRYKVVVIDNAHHLNQEASNALLKFLEEPPGKSLIILITHLPKILLPTIISRCQLVRFKPLNKEEIADYLIEEKKINKKTAQAIAGLSKGSVGQALKLADNFESFQKDIGLLAKLKKADLLARFDFVKRVSGDNDKLDELIGNWILYLGGGIKENFEAVRELRGLLSLKWLVSHPHFNHRLALENFLIYL